MKYILMPARTTSEWDNVDFALVEITPQRIEYFKQMSELAKQVNESHGVNKLTVYADNAKFFTDQEELSLEESDWDIADDNAILIDLDSISLLTQPENTLRDGIMRFDTDGVQFVAYGKHTGEEFWCECSYDLLFNVEQGAQVCDATKA